MNTITIHINDAGGITSVDWQAWILTEIETKACTRDVVAETYSQLLKLYRSSKEADWDWAKINRAIIERWSKSGLLYIKGKAWKLAA